MPRAPVVILVASSLLVATLTRPVSAQGGGGRITVELPRHVQLARAASGAGEARRRAFATAALEVLADSYQQALATSARETPATPARRAKLARWQRATRDLVTDIAAALSDLDAQHPFRLYVDDQHHILVVVGPRQFGISGPGGESTAVLGRRLVEHFCNYNHCPPVAPTGGGFAHGGAEKGTWLLRQHRRPAFEVREVLRCEFSSMEERDIKSRQCRETAAELLRLRTALRRAGAAGHPIDWGLVRAGPPPRGSATHRMVVNRRGAYLQLPLARLAHLPREMWPQVVLWLQREEDPGAVPLVLHDADYLAAMPVGEE